MVEGFPNLWIFFQHFVAIFNPQKSPTLITINGTNEIVTLDSNLLEPMSRDKK